MIIATCDEWIPNKAQFFCLESTGRNSNNIYLYQYSYTQFQLNTESLRWLSHCISWDIKPRPPAVIIPKSAMFMFKDKNETENPRFTEWSSLSKFAHQLGAKDRFKLSSADFKGGSSPTTVSCFSASSSMLRLTSGLAQTYQQLVRKGFFTWKIQFALKWLIILASLSLMLYLTTNLDSRPDTVLYEWVI